MPPRLEISCSGTGAKLFRNRTEKLVAMLVHSLAGEREDPSGDDAEVVNVGDPHEHRTAVAKLE
jgi:hypothetical protein